MFSVKSFTAVFALCLCLLATLGDAFSIGNFNEHPSEKLMKRETDVTEPPAGKDAYDFGTALIELMVTTIDSHRIDMERRSAFTQGVVVLLSKLYPNSNVIMWSRDAGHTVEAENQLLFSDELAIGRDDVMKNAFYSIVVFRGQGTYHSNGADGGYMNRAWLGNATPNEDSSVVQFAPTQ